MVLRTCLFLPFIYEVLCIRPYEDLKYTRLVLLYSSTLTTTRSVSFSIATLSFLLFRQMGKVQRRVKKYASSAALRKLKPVHRPMRPPKDATNGEKQRRLLSNRRKNILKL